MPAPPHETSSGFIPQHVERARALQSIIEGLTAETLGLTTHRIPIGVEPRDVLGLPPTDPPMDWLTLEVSIEVVFEGWDAIVTGHGRTTDNAWQATERIHYRAMLSDAPQRVEFILRRARDNVQDRLRRRFVREAATAPPNDPEVKKRARNLLERVLTNAERREYRKRGCVTIEAPSGNRYRIGGPTWTWRGMFRLNGHGRAIIKYCVHPPPNYPIDDQVAALVLHLRTQEDYVLSTAFLWSLTDWEAECVTKRKRF